MGNGINASRRSPLLIALLDFIFGENESLKSLRGVLWLFEDLQVSSTRILGDYVRSIKPDLVKFYEET